MENDYPVLENQVEFDLYDEVTPILFPLLPDDVVYRARRDMTDGGYPAAGVASALSALTVPVPRSVVDCVEKHWPNLNEYNSDWYGVDRSLGYAIRKNGIDENA